MYALLVVLGEDLGKVGAQLLGGIAGLKVDGLAVILFFDDLKNLVEGLVLAVGIYCYA